MSEYMIAYTSWLEDIDGLSDSERGRLFTALLTYAASGEKQEPRGTERALFHRYCKMIDDAVGLFAVPSALDGVNSKERDERAKESNEKERSKEKENKESEREEREPPTVSPPQNMTLFDQFWAVYPRKVDKQDARKAWNKVKSSEFAEVMNGLRAWARYWNIRREDEFIPYPSTWLNKRRWESAPPTHKSTNPALRYEQKHISKTDFDALVVHFEEEDK